MARSEPIDFIRQQAPKAAELRIGAVAQELLLPLRDVRLGVSLIPRETPGASELIQKIDATLQAMERVVDELVDLGWACSAPAFPKPVQTSGVVLKRSRSKERNRAEAVGEDP
jgi:hypothetical protein